MIDVLFFKYLVKLKFNLLTDFFKIKINFFFSRWIYMDFCKLTPENIIKSCAKFYLVINLFLSIDLTNTFELTGTVVRSL